MIRVYKNNDVKVVTKGVYDTIYAPLGYKLIIEENKQAKAKETTIEPIKEEVVNDTPIVVKEEKTEVTTKTKESSKSTKKRRSE